MTDNKLLIDRKTALRYMGCGATEPESLTSAIGECEEALCRVMTPRYVYTVKTADEVSPILSGEDVWRLISGCDKVVVLAATLGSATDELIRKYQSSDVLRAMITDAEASAAIDVLCDEAEREILSHTDGSLTMRFSPGYGDWPLEAQSSLLDFVDAGRKIGLYVGASDMMTPIKSVTAVAGLMLKG